MKKPSPAVYLDNEQPQFGFWWIRILGITALLISLFLVIALGVGVSYAQDDEDPDPGFQAGDRDFTNPFTPPPPPTGTAPPPAPSRPTSRPSSRPTSSGPSTGTSTAKSSAKPGKGKRVIKFPSNSKDPEDVPNPQETDEGLAVGGEPPGGVISGKKDSGAIDIDDFGYGSKEIVTDFNFPDAEVVSVAKTLGKLTGKNFILDKNVKGKITIISNAPITVGDAWKAFLTALDINGYALVPSGKYIRITRQREARDKQLKTYTGNYSPDSDALITRVFSLKHIDAEEVARTLRSFMPANSRIIPYQQTNTVIVTDTGSNILKLAQLLEVLDVEGFDAGIEVIPVKYASALELAKLIDTLLPGTSAGGINRPGGGVRAGNFTARRTKEGGLINTIIADERTNSLIVHANTKGANQVRLLVDTLDRKMPINAGGGKIHVVYLQFASAEEIAQTLNSLGSGGGGVTHSPRLPGAGGGTGSNPVTGSLFEGAIRISADKATNSLVITASPSDFSTIQRVLARLDIPRDEVYVEAYILEMVLSSNFEYSANLALPTSGVGFTPNSDLIDFLQNPVSQKGLVLGLKSGKETEIKVANNPVKISSVMGLIKAIQTNAKANILATPQILTLDNTKATFETSEKIPVPTTVQNQSTTSTGVTKEPVSLSIELTPHINKISNFVKMEINVKLEDIEKRELPQQVAQLALATFERKANTTIVVADGDTIVLGGLIRDKQVDSISKVPILGDIPLLGWLFRQKSNNTEKSNLMIFLTPNIIRQYEKVRALLDKKLKERDDFIEQNAGGDDPLRPYRDNMIRSLPKMDDLLTGGADSSFTLDSDEGADGKAQAAPKADKVAPKKEAIPGNEDDDFFEEEDGG